jgi:hypothetical protein
MSSEAIQNIANLYANTTGTAIFNNIRSTGKIIGNLTDDVSGNLTGNVTGNVTGKLMSNDNNNSLYLTNERKLIISDKNNTNPLDLIEHMNKSKTARFIRIGNNVSSSLPRVDKWSISEVEVYDLSGNNIAKNKPVSITAGSQYSSYSASNIVNGTNSDANIYYHGNDGANELEIDLGQEYIIYNIVVYGRYHDGYWIRANNTSIQLLDKDKKQNRIIFTGNWENSYSKEYTL